jgi:hypothetical protein
MKSSLRIIVTGLICQHPHLGGITWHYLQYVLGLARLGHDVYYFEDSGEWPYNFEGGPSGNDWVERDCTYNVKYLAKVMSRFGLENRWAYRFPIESRWFGLSEKRRKALIKSADLLINVSGTLQRPEDYRRIPRLAYIDTDPVVTQIKLAMDLDSLRERVVTHDIHFSFGESLSETLPITGYTWHPTRQPIVLSEWRPNTQHRNAFTTVMSWTSYKPLTYCDQIYGQKDIEFRRYLHIPTIVAPTEMEVAIGRVEHLDWQTEDLNLPYEIESSGRGKTQFTTRDILINMGWCVVDAVERCGDFDSYRHYIESSKAEWSVAKNAYVLGQPGWFSERSACYIAAGRPVIVQDTGFSQILPVGEGILPFRTVEEAMAAVQDVETNYARHSEASRAIAESYFDSDCILDRLITEAMR